MNITSCIERIEVFEENLGIVLSALSANISDEADSDGEYRYCLTGEIMSENGKLDQNIDIKLAMYDDSGAVIKTDYAFVDSDDFMGFDVFEISGYITTNNIQKVRIFPKRT